MHQRAACFANLTLSYGEGPWWGKQCGQETLIEDSLCEIKAAVGQDPQTNVPLFILCALKWSFCRASLFSRFLYIFVPSCARRNPPTGRRVSSPGRLPSSRSVKNHSAIFCNMVHHYLCSLIISKLFDHFDRFSMLWPRHALLIAFEQSPGFRTCTIFPMAVRLAYSESRSLLPGSANSDAEVRWDHLLLESHGLFIALPGGIWG